MDSKTEEFYQQQRTREGRCIDCGAKIAVIDGVRSGCDCSTSQSETEREKQFAHWFEAMCKKYPRPRI